MKVSMLLFACSSKEELPLGRLAGAEEGELVRGEAVEDGTGDVEEWRESELGDKGVAARLTVVEGEESGGDDDDESVDSECLYCKRGCSCRCKLLPANEVEEDWCTSVGAEVVVVDGTELADDK